MQIIARIVVLLLRMLEALLVLRAVLSWFPLQPDNPLRRFAYMTTEPVAGPVRTLLYRLFPRLESFPFDLSFLIVFVIIQLLISLL